MTTFQQRHFEAIAEVLQEAYRNADCIRYTAHNAVAMVQEELAKRFARDNGRFDRGRFERACVPGANVRNRTR